MKTLDETQQRRTINLMRPAPKVPAQPTLFDIDPLHVALDNPLPPPRDDSRPAPRVAGDELFPEEGPQPLDERQAATLCVVCELGRVSVTAPARLCPACLEDPARTRAHVESTLDAAAGAFLAACAAADDATLTRWHKAEALLSNSPAGFWEAWKRHLEAQTPLGVLFAAYERYAELRAWADRARGELSHVE